MPGREESYGFDPERVAPDRRSTKLVASPARKTGKRTAVERSCEIPCRCRGRRFLVFLPRRPETKDRPLAQSPVNSLRARLQVLDFVELN